MDAAGEAFEAEKKEMQEKFVSGKLVSSHAHNPTGHNIPITCNILNHILFLWKLYECKL